jgi:predicted lipoprotein with Yx(FWY)xxD motif
MRKSGWTIATGLSSLVLLLTACGGSSTSTSTTGAASGTLTQGTASSSSLSSGPASSATSSPKSTAHAKATSPSSSSKRTAQAQPSSNVTFPAVGTTVLIVMHSNLGWVMATAKGLVVYTFGKDSKGAPPTCTGSCAAVWAPVTGVPKAGPADTFPGTFGVVTGAGGKKVITYDGYPLYTFVDAPPLSTKGNGLEGVWHVIMLSAGDVQGA